MTTHDGHTPTPLLSFDLPPGWRTRAHPDAGVVAHARPRRRRASGVPPEVVLRAVTVEDDLAAWRAGAARALAAQLDGFELEDEDDYELGAGPVHYQRFGHRLGTTELISEQWSWLVGGLGVTLTCTVAREQYAGYCELFEDVAATVEITAPAA